MFALHLFEMAAIVAGLFAPSPTVAPVEPSTAMEPQAPDPAPLPTQAPKPISETNPNIETTHPSFPTATETTSTAIEPDPFAAPASLGDPMDPAAAAAWGEIAKEQHEPTFDVRFYGFIDAYAEKVGKTPAGIDPTSGNTVFEKNPYEFDIPNLNFMLQGSIHRKFRFYTNLVAPGSGGHREDTPVGVRNAWVEVSLWRDFIAIRAGKLYRRFGLYNEILDAVPTFIGIEPPEIFDRDHLLVTRTTNLMLFGRAALGSESSLILNYAVTTGNDERDAESIPIGADVNAEYRSWLLIGSSFYHSGGTASPLNAVGEGSPRGGVLPWMAEDKYFIFGGYAQIQKAGATVQAEYWEAHHNAIRDADSVLALDEAGLSDRQRRRFYTGGDPALGARLDGDYKVRTAYLRFGWQFPIGSRASLTPYLQGDYYANREVIANKSFGGDNEAGLADDGSFQKYTLGVVVRPVPQVALKLDASTHVHLYNDDWIAYPEGRVSFSYLWELPIRH